MVHPEFAAMVAEAVKAKHPGASDALIAIAVRGVATSPEFVSLAGFMDRGLASGVFAQAITAQAQAIADAASQVSAPTASPQLSRPKNPTAWLGQHYQQQAGERADIEGPALAARIAEGRATPLDKLQQRPAPPTKEERRAADNPKVNTADLAEITDPNKRHAAIRGRVADTRAVERLRLDQTAYTRKALDPNTPPNIRAQANSELARIAERLKALGND